MRVRLLAALLIGSLMVVLLLSQAAAESQSRTILGQTLYGLTTSDRGDEFGPYSLGLSYWQGCCGTFAYMSVGSNGYNDDGGWHLVWNSFKSCANCVTTDATYTYRCGWLGCGPYSYVASRHYFESSAIAGTATFYTSHNGLRSTSSCYYTAGC